MALAKKQKKITTLTPAQRAKRREKRQHINYCRSLFSLTGFQRVASVDGREFTYENIKSEFDDIFLLENVVVVCEYTCASESNVGTHLKNKSFLYKKIMENNAKFLEFLIQNYPDFALRTKSEYLNHHYEIRIVYASKNKLKEDIKDLVPDVKFLDYNILRYFESLAGTIRHSARFELLEFMNIGPKEFGLNSLSPNTSLGSVYRGSVLPESNSHFPPGFKVVSFYVDAESLLSRVYVLRREGWRSGINTYQRMVSRTKVNAIRSFVLAKNGVFINNIVATLPASTKLIDENDNTIDVSSIKSTQPGRVQVPAVFNSIGLIDGQHRVYCYHEGGSRDNEIAVLRKQQTLLVTGIVFPASMTSPERARFEAKLFLDINSNQTNAKSALKQEVGLILRPFELESVARRVVNTLNDRNGPLNDQFERYFFDKNKMKTTTVVSYGLRPILRLDLEGPLFAAWPENKKSKLLEDRDENLLEEYISFSAGSLNLFFGAARSQIGSSRWTADKRVDGFVLRTTIVNGLIACFRRCVKRDGLKDFDEYRSKLSGLSDFDFSAYRSSQYDKLGQVLFEKYF